MHSRLCTTSSAATLVSSETTPATSGDSTPDAVAGTAQATGGRSGRSRVVKVAQTIGKFVVEIDPAVLCEIFGVSDALVATRLLSQLINILQPDPNKPFEAELVNQALGMVEDIGPKGMLESATATLLVAAHYAAHESIRRAQHPEQTPAGRALYGALGFKAMRTYARLLEAFNQGRGKGFVQKIIVERITVEPGAQAVVGAVDFGSGRGQAK
jgi:hypothetical protein